MGTKLTILLFLIPSFLFSQSEGGFGFRRFSTTTTMNNVAPSNINTSHSRNAYVHSNGLYYVWDGNSWEREEDIDTFSLSGTTVSISLYGDGVPVKTIDLSTATGWGVNIFNSNGTQDDAERLFTQDSTRIFGMGQFPDFPDVAFDGRDKGYYYAPDYTGEISIYNGNGVTGQQSYLSVYNDNILTYSTRNSYSAQSQIITANTSGEITLQLDEPTIDYGALQLYGRIGSGQEAIGFRQNGRGSNLPASMYFGEGLSSSLLYTDTDRAWGVQTLAPAWKYHWIKITIPDTDSLGNNISFYNKSYYFPNDVPSITLNDTSVIAWRGDGTSSGDNPMFLNLGDFVGTNSVNIYNSNGTQDDADRLFTQDSTRTFAMGQFTSVSTPTWGRGYYYDPSTANGIRLLNKNGANTTTAMVELDPEAINIQTTHTTSTSLNTQVTLSQIAEHTSTVSRTSSTYGSLVRTSLTNSNEEVVALTQNGNGTIPTVSMYLGDGYASSSHAKYADRAWGVQSHIASGGFDWLQILLPDTGTDTTGNNINFYNRKYFWSNERPSITNGDTSVHVWIGNGTTTTPDFINLADFVTTNSGHPIPDGEVAFGNPAGTNITSSSQLHYDGTVLSVGLGGDGDIVVEGTSSPSITLDDGAASSSTGGGILVLQSDDGAAITSGHRLGVIDFFGSTAAASVGRGAMIEAFATGTWTTGNTRSRLSFSTSPNGSSTPLERMRLTHDGYMELYNNGTIAMYDAANNGVSYIGHGSDTSMYILPRGGTGSGGLILYGKVGYESASVTLLADANDMWIGEEVIFAITANATDRTITGIQPGLSGAGRFLILYNNDGVGAGTNVILEHESLSSSAANRFDLPDNTDLTITPGKAVFAFYSTGAARWVVVGKEGSGTDTNIANSDLNMDAGGHVLTMDTIGETFRITMNTGNTTTREMIRMSTVENAVTRYLVLTSPVDSFRLYRVNTGREYGLQTFGGTALRMTSDSIISFLADSILFVEGTVQSVTTSRFLLGLTNNNYLKRYDGDAATSGTFLKSNGTDWTYADFLSTYSNATEATSAFTATSADTDLNFAIIPKGDGALTMDVPDGGTGGGNARGTGAVDLQTSRDAATQVASSSWSAILGGRRNTASADGAATIAGADNIASGQGAVVIGGYTSSSVGGANVASGTNSGTWGLQDTASATNSYAIGAQCVASASYSIATNAQARAYLYGQRANGGTTFVADLPGTAQSSYLIMSRQITGTAQTELFLDGSSLQAILLGTNRGWNFKVDVVGICNTVGNGVGITVGDTWTSWHVGGIKRLGTTTSLVGTVQAPATAQADAGMSTTVVTIDADDGTEALRVRITPPTTSGSTTVTRWVVTISLTEAAY